MASDADDGLDGGRPLGLSQLLVDGEDFDGAMLLSGPAFVLGGGCVGGAARGGDGFDGVGQMGLIILELDEQVIARGQGRGEGFFGRAWRRG